jgi:hypothetical protein
MAIAWGYSTQKAAQDRAKRPERRILLRFTEKIDLILDFNRFSMQPCEYQISEFVNATIEMH